MVQFGEKPSTGTLFRASQFLSEELPIRLAHRVQELNDLLCVRMADGALVTLVLAVVDADRNRLVWCSAGHPPPVLLDANGGLRTLDDPDPPCGVFPCERYHQTEES